MSLQHLTRTHCVSTHCVHGSFLHPNNVILWEMEIGDCLLSLMLFLCNVNALSHVTTRGRDFVWGCGIIGGWVQL